MWEKIRALLAKLFAPAITVGDKRRVRGKDEKDGDEELFAERNRAWLQMLREDEWMQKLGEHKKLLIALALLCFSALIYLGLTEQASHWVFDVLSIFNGLLIVYFFWIYIWENRIVQRVFEKFRERFGKYFHLR